MAETLAFEKQCNPLLSADRETFVHELSRQALSQPADMQAILQFNQGRL